MGIAAARIGTLRAAHPAATHRLLEAFDTALQAVEPRRLVRESLAREGRSVRIGSELFAARKVLVLAFGKGAPEMAHGADEALGDLIQGGLVVTDVPAEVPPWANLVEAGHPIPNKGSVEGAHAALALVESMTPRDLLITLVSGGGSAILEAPADGLTLEGLQDLNDQLILSGAPIGAINQVRRAVSLVKGGRLAARCRGRIATLILSDVGPDPSVVASGPTVATVDDGTPLSQILDRFEIEGPAARCARRRAGLLAGTPLPPNDSNPALILADWFTAGRAATRYLAQTGISTRLEEEPLAGETGAAIRDGLNSTSAGTARVLVGETTLEVSGKGRGGRNQHAALIAGIELAGSPYRVLAVGTDGIDGPTDAAGGCVDGTSVTDSRLARIHLARHDSYPHLKAVGALLRTGKTGTNVADLWIVDKSIPYL